MHLNKFLYISLLIFSSFAWSAEILPEKLNLSVSLDEIEQTIREKPPCSELRATSVCRAWQWVLREDEGIFSVGPLGVIVISNNPPPNSEASILFRSLGSDRILESTIVFSLSSASFSVALAKSSYTSFLILLRDSKSKKIVAGLLTSQQGFLNFYAQNGVKWLEELKTQPAWFFPKDFTPFYQFESF